MCINVIHSFLLRFSFPFLHSYVLKNVVLHSQTLLNTVLSGWDLEGLFILGLDVQTHLICFNVGAQHNPKITIKAIQVCSQIFQEVIKKSWIWFVATVSACVVL